MKKVEVYWNLHRKCWSIRHNGRVIEHTSHVMLEDVQFVVQPAGNRKVRETGRKHVHAFARGMLREWDADEADRVLLYGSKVTYNPYKYTSFVKVVGGTNRQIDAIYDAEIATLTPIGVRAI